MVSSRDEIGTTTTRERGQLLLIAAIAIAFIVLGMVVVFNGVLYTQTISSSSSGQSMTNADRVQHELTDGVCTLNETDSLDEDNLTAMTELYENATTASHSSLVNATASDEGENITNVTIAYDSNDVSYTSTYSINVTARC